MGTQLRPGTRPKAGQLSWGSGTTPTFFGSNNSRVAIVDSADEVPQYPEKATFKGGLTRVYLVNGNTCVRRWENQHRISTLPMLTLRDNRIWSLTMDEGSPLVFVVSADAATGKETHAPWWE